jgi:hypothetical protein
MLFRERLAWAPNCPLMIKSRRSPSTSAIAAFVGAKIGTRSWRVAFEFKWRRVSELLGFWLTFGEEKHEKSPTEQRTLALTANCSVLAPLLFRFNRTTASLFCLNIAASPKVSQNPEPK